MGASGDVARSAAASVPQPLNDPRNFAPEWAGEPYASVIERLHAVLQPRTYLEIGVLLGGTFRLAQCPRIAIDPGFMLSAEDINTKPVSLLFRLPSDEFFAQYNVRNLFGRELDMAFLDGLHLFEFLLRDFYNTEIHCHSKSVILVHDLLPTDVGMSRRDQRRPKDLPTRNPKRWAGDVWKLLPVLRKYRPDLRIICLDAPPTGLVLITGLDPTNRVLQENYDAILAEAAGLVLEEVGMANFVAHQRVWSTDSFQDPALIKSHLFERPGTAQSG
ncbi:class I SAM-dependent methyltransferase [Sediminicoccus sp. KRV36]|uniref:class I SAM-dependent methyltransferase n=1 Tax=Sediminicoccus sp. KRV36 TaxID=3133721 RepID=UPI00200ED3F8|nr:class I SAM-dependent methyltransferase [Sediminicoccus rosea]UPY36559.1 class I SAM-dependent methyltransferase [Sediminicoccus rosea]